MPDQAFHLRALVRAAAQCVLEERASELMVATHSEDTETDRETDHETQATPPPPSPRQPRASPPSPVPSPVSSDSGQQQVPPVTLGRSDVESVRRATEAIAHGIGVVGLLNVQYALKDDVLYVLEANPRASRTVPSTRFGCCWASSLRA